MIGAESKSVFENDREIEFLDWLAKGDRGERFMLFEVNHRAARSLSARGLVTEIREAEGGGITARISHAGREALEHYKTRAGQSRGGSGPAAAPPNTSRAREEFVP